MATLDLDGEQTIDDPDEATVCKAIAELARDAFVIYAKGDEEYIQTYRNQDDTWDVEYRAGSAEAHFHTQCNEPHGVVALFSAYLSGEWQSAADWQPLVLPPQDELV